MTSIAASEGGQSAEDDLVCRGARLVCMTRSHRTRSTPTYQYPIRLQIPVKTHVDEYADANGLSLNAAMNEMIDRGYESWLNDLDTIPGARSSRKDAS